MEFSSGQAHAEGRRGSGREFWVVETKVDLVGRAGEDLEDRVCRWAEGHSKFDDGSGSSWVAFELKFEEEEECTGGGEGYRLASCAGILTFP
jgi:hypothetical protein